MALIVNDFLNDDEKQRYVYLRIKIYSKQILFNMLGLKMGCTENGDIIKNRKKLVNIIGNEKNIFQAFLIFLKRSLHFPQNNSVKNIENKNK